MKHKNFDNDREKRIHKIDKGTNFNIKHKKSIYNMLSDVEEEDFDDYDSVYSDTQVYYKLKQR